MSQTNKIINEYRATQYLEAILRKWEIYDDDALDNCVEYALKMRKRARNEFELYEQITILASIIDDEMKDVFTKKKSVRIAVCGDDVLYLAQTDGWREVASWIYKRDGDMEN